MSCLPTVKDITMEVTEFKGKGWLCKADLLALHINPHDYPLLSMKHGAVYYIDICLSFGYHLQRPLCRVGSSDRPREGHPPNTHPVVAQRRNGAGAGGVPGMVPNQCRHCQCIMPACRYMCRKLAPQTGEMVIDREKLQMVPRLKC